MVDSEINFGIGRDGGRDLMTPEITGHLFLDYEADQTAIHHEGSMVVAILPTNAELMEKFIKDYQHDVISRYYSGLQDDESEDNTESRANQERLVQRLPTPAEHQVLFLLAAGMTNKEIGEFLGNSDQTIKNHITSLLHRFKTTSREKLVTQATIQRTIEPLLITVEADFSRITQLSSKEQQIYSCLTGENPLTNKEIGDEKFLTEQTIKNHVTSIFRKLGLTSRAEVSLYEMKRLEAILMREHSDLSLERIEEILLSVLTMEPTLGATKIPPFMMPEHSQTSKAEIYKKLFVPNLTDCAAVGLLYGFNPLEAFVSKDEQEAIASLPDRMQNLIREFLSFPDSQTFSNRAQAMGYSSSELKGVFIEMIKSSEIPSIYQAGVYLRYEQLSKARKNLHLRKSGVESLRKIYTLSDQEESFIDDDSWED